MKKGIFTFICIFTLAMSQLPMVAYAASNGGTQATTKTETVYINLDSAGTTEQINVVNAFDVSSGETIYDYGNYTEVKNLTDTSKITVDGNLISAVTSSDTFYYQGKLEQTELPWDISVRYFLDGSELTADRIAGKSGEFELRISIMAGSERHEKFFKQYIMQISLTLNKDLFTNITTENGSVNVLGRTASVSYTHSMNTEAKYVLHAYVNDFEMGAIQFQAASMGSVGLRFDDISAVSTASQELAKATETLNQKVTNISSQTWDPNNPAWTPNPTDPTDVPDPEDPDYLGYLTYLAYLTNSYIQTLDGSSNPNVRTLATLYIAQQQAIAQLASSINELNTAYTQFDAELQDGLGSILPSEPAKISFVSEENAVDSVLFIMQTNEIAAPQSAADVAPPDSRPETFWDRLLNLFGLWQS